MDGLGVDEFGREHFVVEAAPGRLGIALGETDQGFVVVRGLDELKPQDLEGWDEVDRKRMQIVRQTVKPDDRLVAIDGDDVVHCCMREIIVRLNNLAAKKRLLTFARYHGTHCDTKRLDVEKLVHVRAPSGPLGVLINHTLTYGAFIDGFQQLPDGSSSRLERDPKIHRGCQIIRVNDIDVSYLTREAVISLLAGLKDQDKEIILYRATPGSCESIVKVEYATADVPLGLDMDDHEKAKCVVTSAMLSGSAAAAGTAEILPGDVLMGVNTVDVTYMSRQEALKVLRNADFPRTLFFYRPRTETLPECHRIRIESGPFGLNLDSRYPDHAVISGFTSSADAERPEFQHCARFLPGSVILSINKLDVSQQSLKEITSLLQKLKDGAKNIIVGNTPLVQNLARKRCFETVQVPAGALGVHFSSVHADRACIDSFYAVDSQAGAIEQSGRIPIGSTLRSINNMNVSCLTLAQITDMLRKLSDRPKELCFYLRNHAQDVNTHVVHASMPPGPLGADLKCSLSNKVIVDRLNHDPAQGSTQLYDFGGVIEGSELLAIDGFDVSALDLVEISQLLRTMASHEKVITFSSSISAHARMLNPEENPSLCAVTVTQRSLGIEFDSQTTQMAVISGFARSQDPATAGLFRNVPVGSRLIAMDQIDLRSMPLQEIVKVLGEFSGVTRTLVFDTAHGSKKRSLSSTESSMSPPSSASAAVAPVPTTEGSMASPPKPPTGLRFSLPVSNSAPSLDTSKSDAALSASPTRVRSQLAPLSSRSGGVSMLILFVLVGSVAARNVVCSAVLESAADHTAGSQTIAVE